MTPLPLDERWRMARARAGSLLMDTVLVAYAAWCIQFLLVRMELGGAYLTRWPLLLAGAPILALLWRASTNSLGQRGYRDRLVQVDDAAREATPDQRLTAALVGAVSVAAVVGLPVALGGSSTGIVLAVVLAAGLGWVRMIDAQARSLGERWAGVRPTLRPLVKTRVAEAWYRRPNGWAVLLLLGLTFAVGWSITGVKVDRFVSGWGNARPMLEQLTTPDWAITGRVIELMVETVFIALVASALALPVAFVLSFLGARNVMRRTAGGRAVYFLARFLMNLTRSVEPIIWVIIFLLWVGMGPFAGVLALFVHSVAALSKLYSEAIESIDPGPVEALEATGASPMHVIRYGMVPQVIPPFLSFTVYRWDINVRMATILGFVGGGGIGELLLPLTQMGVYSKVGVIIVFITIVVWIMDIASSKARERLV